MLVPNRGQGGDRGGDDVLRLNGARFPRASIFGIPFINVLGIVEYEKIDLLMQ